jgi:hypothetical protein
MTEEQEREELIVQRRAKKFIEDGCESEYEAYELAWLLALRDREQGADDRRICFECKHYANKKCSAILDKFGKPTQQLRFILQRCDYFQLKGTK